ncbi:transforming growth factor beta activator LRRC32 [Trichomycterus rosablanca]|uniref:transforming growth factor beta activator LRRC32 n=1 Tax=Trichomycterus rosablanca TaxID=2290929 RepID=UPI002F35E2BC
MTPAAVSHVGYDERSGERRKESAPQAHISTMSVQLCFLFFLVNEAAALLHLRQLSPCQVLQSEVNCRQLNLRRIPHQLPPGIHSLDLSLNLLQNLTEDVLSSYPTIHQLNLHYNMIQFIQPGLFRDMTHLKVLDLSNNQLDTYAALKTHVGPLTSVQELDLSGNGLYTDMSDFFLRDAPALTNLSLNGNSITKIGKDTFNGSLALKSIDLHNNVILEIEEGSFDPLLHLTDLDLSVNSISCITDFNLFQLKSLNLSKNSMTSFQSVDTDPEFELLYLDLRENKIRYFPVLPRRNKILYLDLSRNQIHSLNYTSEAEELQYLREREEWAHPSPHRRKRPQKLYSLLYLDLCYNQLKAIPPGFFCSMVALETLNISNNCLDHFVSDTESPLNTLKTLDLSFNNLQKLSFQENTLQALEKLYVQGNYLSTLDPEIFSRLPSIVNLQLQRNDLSVCGPDQNQTDCVSLNSIPTLQYLYLSENNMLSLPAHAFRESPLLILDLSLNPGIEINEDSLSGLESTITHLFLKGDELESLNINLSVLHSLKVVDLSSNRLTSLPLGSRDSSIESLNLQNNNLVTLDIHTVMALKNKLKTLYMGSNPLNCCGNMPLINLVQQASVDIPDIAMVTCQHIKDAGYIDELNLRNVKPEHCETLNSTEVLVITVITVLVLGLVVVLLVSVKFCHTRSHRFNNSYKA